MTSLGPTLGSGASGPRPSRRHLLRGLLAGGLTLAAAPLLAACGGAPAVAGQAGATKPAAQATPAVKAGSAVTVEMNDQNRFVPDTLTIAKGTTVTWKNVGTMIHNVTTDPATVLDKANAKTPAGVEPFSSPMVNGGGAWSHQFTVAGDYAYYCLPHQAMGMVAKLTVTE